MTIRRMKFTALKSVALAGLAALSLTPLATSASAQAWAARHGMTGAQYQAEFNKWTAQGYKPAHVDGYKVGGTVYYAAIWTKGGGAYVARHGLSGAQYQAEFTKWTGKGYRLHDVSGYDGGGSARYAAIWYK